jgi:Mechanosensitive ion channel, conserved TM helix
MDNNLESPFFDFGKQIINYLPNLLAGIILLLVGWFVGWIAKRILIQLLVILKVEKLFIRLQWRRALSKADIRYAVFNMIGNIVFFIIFLIFLNSALDAMKLTILSSLIQQSVVFIPKLMIALIILGLGWIVASRVSNSVYNALLKENVPQYSIISRFVKFVALLFFSSMALVEIDIAPQVVIIGFTTIMITLGIIIVTITAFGSRSSVSNFFNVVDKNKE